MRRMKNKKIKIYIASIIIALAAGGLSALFSVVAMAEYGSLLQPPLSPPSWLFPIVWTVLYILMGISSARIYIADGPYSPKALRSYAMQLVINILWTLLYFTFELRLASFVWIIVLIAAVIVMIVRFFKVDRLAAYLQAPYLIWLIFAAYLNLGTYLLNG